MQIGSVYIAIRLILFNQSKQNRMRKIMYTLLAMFIATTLFSQAYVERALILNEGYFDYLTNTIITPVTIGAYDPAADTYAVINTVDNARFASDIKMDAAYYYVAADKYLLKYDRFTDALVNSVEVEGIRKIAFDNDYIVVTRGEYLVPLESYIQVYDKNTLSLLFEIPAADLNYTTEGVVIKDGIAYVAVNNGFDFGNEVGMIATIDLAAHSLTATVDLGADGINPDNLMINGDDIYTLNNKDFSGSSVSNYKIGTGYITTTNLLNISSGCGTSVMVSGAIYYQEMLGTTLSKYDPVAATLISETEFGTSFYGLAHDDINDLFYASETDYFSYGKVNIYNNSGVLVTSFDVSVSPGNIAFDERVATGITSENKSAIALYPNPVNDQLHISADGMISDIIISDLTGKEMTSVHNVNQMETTIAVDQLPAGNYLVNVVTDQSSNAGIISVNK